MLTTTAAAGAIAESNLQPMIFRFTAAQFYEVLSKVELAAH
jgi:hypothetical protein